MTREQLVWYGYKDWHYAHAYEDRAAKQRIMRHRLCAEQNYRCAYCGKKVDTTVTCNTHNFASLDHVKPKIYGGEDIYDNIVVACSPCNTKKGCMDVQEFLDRFIHTTVL